MQAREAHSQDDPRIDTSEGRPVHLHVGRGGAYMRLSPSAHLLLQRVREGTSFAALAEAMSRAGARPISAAEVQSAYEGLLRRMAEIESRPAGFTGGGAFWFRRTLLPAALVARVARVLSRAFQPAAAALLLLMAGIAMGIITPIAHFVATGSFLSAYALFLLSLLCHELGHASACARYGAAPSEIGLTAYLIYPAFYSNVTSAWALRRWQRVVVDLGGVYFQLIFGAGCALAYALCRWEPLRTTLVLIAGSCLFSLNPILKFDGYWVVADALGVTNLGQQPMRLLRWALARLRLGAFRPAPLPWPAPITAALLLYAAISLAFWVLFLLGLAPALLSCARGFPAAVAAVARPLLRRSWPGGSAIETLLGSSYLLLFLVCTLGQLARSLVGRARRAGRLGTAG